MIWVGKSQFSQTNWMPRPPLTACPIITISSMRCDSEPWVTGTATRTCILSGKGVSSLWRSAIVSSLSGSGVPGGPKACAGLVPSQESQTMSITCLVVSIWTTPGWSRCPTSRMERSSCGFARDGIATMIEPAWLKSSRDSRNSLTSIFLMLL